MGSMTVSAPDTTSGVCTSPPDWLGRRGLGATPFAADLLFLAGAALPAGAALSAGAAAPAGAACLGGAGSFAGILAGRSSVRTLGDRLCSAMSRPGHGGSPPGIRVLGASAACGREPSTSGSTHGGAPAVRLLRGSGGFSAGMNRGPGGSGTWGRAVWALPVAAVWGTDRAGAGYRPVVPRRAYWWSAPSGSVPPRRSAQPAQAGRRLAVAVAGRRLAVAVAGRRLALAVAGRRLAVAVAGRRLAASGSSAVGSGSLGAGPQPLGPTAVGSSGTGGPSSIGPPARPSGTGGSSGLVWPASGPLAGFSAGAAFSAAAGADFSAARGWCCFSRAGAPPSAAAGACFSAAEGDLGLLNQSDHSYWLFSVRSIDWYCSPAATGSLTGPDRASLRRPGRPRDWDL